MQYEKCSPNLPNSTSTARRNPCLPDERGGGMYFVSQVNVNIFKESTQMIEGYDTFSVGISSIDEKHMEPNKAIIINEHNDNTEKKSGF